MKVVASYDDAIGGWMRRLAQTATPAADRWNFTADTLSSSHIFYVFVIN